MTDLTFITGNQNKAYFLAKHLGLPVVHHKLDLDEIQSLDPHEVVEHKVRQAYDVLHTPVLVEDASLIFTAMGRLPGTYIKWFVEELGREGLAQLAQHLPEQTAIGRVVYGLYDGADMRFFEGEMHGTIAPEPRGENGFGYDPIFINDGYDKTRAEMNEDDYAASSYRTPALAELRAYLQDHA
jgi:non-canonical purine NTP pyrophosphatase (RdgB/HAM1 family)